MSDQLALPFVALVGASPAAPPEAFPGVTCLRRNPARTRQLPVASRGAEQPPMPGTDDEAGQLDVHDYLVRRDEASFIFELRDDAMTGAGLFEGDMLIVDKRIQPTHGHIVVAYINGERLVRRLHHRGRKTALYAEHPDFAEINFEDGSELTLWGVVVGSFKRIGA